MKRALGVAAAVAMAVPGPALAKGLTERLQVFPSHPRVGRPVTLQLRPYELGSPAFLEQDFAWRVTAHLPGRHPHRITLVRQTRDPYVWSGRIRFRSPYPPAPETGWGDWGGNKINWLRDLAYPGPVLIRGLRLDGPDELRFNDGRLPSLSMRQKGRSNPSYTRVRIPGCYAYQVDGTTFSDTIAFEAKLYGS